MTDQIGIKDLYRVADYMSILALGVFSHELFVALSIPASTNAQVGGAGTLDVGRCQTCRHDQVAVHGLGKTVTCSDTRQSKASPAKSG